MLTVYWLSFLLLLLAHHNFNPSTDFLLTSWEKLLWEMTRCSSLLKEACGGFDVCRIELIPPVAPSRAWYCSSLLPRRLTPSNLLQKLFSSTQLPQKHVCCINIIVFLLYFNRFLALRRKPLLFKSPTGHDLPSPSCSKCHNTPCPSASSSWYEAICRVAEPPIWKSVAARFQNQLPGLSVYVCRKLDLSASVSSSVNK